MAVPKVQNASSLYVKERYVPASRHGYLELDYRVPIVGFGVIFNPVGTGVLGPAGTPVTSEVA